MRCDTSRSPTGPRRERTQPTPLVPSRRHRSMNIIQDLGFAWRSLRARAGTASFAMLTLATGLAAAIAIGCVVDAVMLRALPYPEANQLVEISEVSADGHLMPLAQPNYDDIAASVDAFASSAYHYAWPGTIRSGDATIRATIDTSGGDFFSTIGVAPELGRAFGKDEHEKVAVVSDALWQGLLAKRADIVGTPIDLNGERYTIIGVMPHGFAFPADTVVWTPNLDPPYASRTAHNFDAIARLRAADSLGQARLAATTLAGNLKARLGKDIDAANFDVTPLRDAIAAPARTAPARTA